MTPATASAATPAKPGTTGSPRVCVVNANLPPEYGGAELAGFEYARRLREAGGEVTLIGRARGSGLQADGNREWVYPAVAPEAEAAGGPARLVPGAVRAAMRLGGPLWRRMSSLRHRYDVVHVFNSSPPFNLLAAPFGRLLGKRVVLEMSLMGSDDALTLRERGSGWKPSFRFALFRLAHAHVAKSPALADAYRRSGLADERLWLIPYGVDVEQFRPSSDRERIEVRKELGLPENGVLALFVGGINARKGVHRLVECFALIEDDHPGLHLALVGPTEKYDPAYVDRVRAEITTGGLSDRVTLVDRVVDNVHEYMRAADIYVLPSTREGLPITVLEAMASGLAVLASDIPEISGSQVESGETGLLVPVGDVDALADGLAALAGDAELRSRLGDAARKRAEESFSSGAVDEQYRRLYEDIE